MSKNRYVECLRAIFSHGMAGDLPLTLLLLFGLPVSAFIFTALEGALTVGNCEGGNYEELYAA